MRDVALRAVERHLGAARHLLAGRGLWTPVWREIFDQVRLMAEPPVSKTDVDDVDDITDVTDVDDVAAVADVAGVNISEDGAVDAANTD